MWMSLVAKKVWMRGRTAPLHGLPRPVNVVLVGARQPGNDRRRDTFPPWLSTRGWRPTVLAIWRTASRSPGLAAGKARLHDVDAQAGQLLGNIQFFLGVEGCAGALFTIAQGGVKDHNPFTVGNGAGMGGNVGNAELLYVYFGYVVADTANTINGYVIFVVNAGCFGHHLFS